MKKIRTRILSLVLVATMIMSLAMTNNFNVLAEDSAKDVIGDIAEFTVTSAKGVSGKTVDIEVRISENSQICAADWELQFDSSELLFKEFVGGDILSVGMYAYNANVSDCVKISFSSLEPLTNGGSLFKVTFGVTGENYNEDLDIKLAVNNLVTTESNSAEYLVHNGHVEIVDLLYGDVDLDNRISTIDVLKVLSSLTEATILTEEELKIADVNGDSAVSVVDALQMLYFTAEMGETLYVTEDGQIDFFIYNLFAPEGIYVSELNEYNFTVSWETVDYAIGYNLYFDGQQVNQYMLTDTSVTIGCTPDGKIVGHDSIAPLKHNSIDQNSTHTIEVTAINALKESDRSEVLSVTTKRHHSGVTFKNWDGTILDQQKVLYGQDAVEPNAPTKTGYTFIGWDKPTTNIVDDTVITALFEINKYDYVFYDWNNTEISRQQVAYEGTATPPTDPQRTGYTFKGWYTHLSDGTEVTDFSNATCAQNFYAQYDINQYTVAFESNGGTSVSGYSVDYLSKLTAPTNPTRYSYVFGGWYKDSACKNKWNFDMDSIKGDTTLYAKWVPIVITINKSAVTFTTAGKTEQLSVSFSSGNDTIKWYSDNTKVATVNEGTGLVTSVGHGTANIYIQGQNSERRAVCKVTVVAKKDAWIYGTGSSLTIRTQPTTSCSAVGSLSDGDQISVLGDIQAQGVSGQKGWYQMESAKGNGYVSANYVTFTKPTVSNNGTLSGTFAEKLAYLRNTKFPNGKYWNHHANNNHNHSGVFGSCTNTSCKNPDGYTNSPCSSHWGTVNTGGYDCNLYDGAIQCMGFALKVFSDVWGQSARNGQTISPRFENIKAGDYLRINGDSHSVFVIEKGSNYIKTVECNFCWQDEYGNWHGTNEACKIKWDVVRYQGKFTITSIKRAW